MPNPELDGPLTEDDTIEPCPSIPPAPPEAWEDDEKTPWRPGPPPAETQPELRAIKIPVSTSERFKKWLKGIFNR